MANGGADRSSIFKLKPVRVATCRVIRSRPGVKGENMRADRTRGVQQPSKLKIAGVRLSLPAPVSITINRYRIDSCAVVAEMD